MYQQFIQFKMNKEKLIGLIIKKETYKDTRPIQNDISKKKEQAVIVSISAIYQILKDDYNAEAKLYAVRYLKDCFQRGNQSFITKVQEKILPILVTMVKDSEDQKAILKYGGSYTKTKDLENFKSLVTSLFTMSQECIYKWADWIPDSNRKFCKARQQIAHLKKNPNRDSFIYFRQENESIFRQNCKKNGVVLLKNQQRKQNIKPKQSAIKIVQANVNQQLTKTKTPVLTDQKIEKSRPKHKLQSIIKAVQQKIQKKQMMTKQQYEQIDNKFNCAVNQYIQQASEFDQHFIQDKINRFEAVKTEYLQILNSESDKKLNKKPPTIQSSNLNSDATFKNINSDKAANSKNTLPLNSEPKLSQKHYQREVMGTNKSENEKLQTPNIVIIPAKNEISKIKNSQAKKMKVNDDGYSQLKEEGEWEEPSQRVKFEQSYSQSIRNSKIQNKGLIKKQEQKQKQVKNLAEPKKETPPFSSNKTTAKFLPDQQFTPVQNTFNKEASDLTKQKIQLSKKQNKSASQPVVLQKQTANKRKTNQIKAVQIMTDSLQQQKNRQIESLRKKYEYETSQLLGQIQKLQKQMSDLRSQQKQSRISQKSSKLDAKELEFLKQRLEKQKKDKQDMQRQMDKLKNELKKIGNRYDKSKQQLKNSISKDYSVVQVENQNQSHKNLAASRTSKITKVKPLNIDNYQSKSDFGLSRVKNSVIPVQSPTAVNPYSIRIDEDYINDNTNYEKIGSWLQQKNQIRFKQSILGISQDCFYKDQNLKIYKMQNLFSENGAQFLKMTFSYHFAKAQQRFPKIVYKNIAEIDFWTKPITGTQQKFSQQTIGRLCLVPLKIMKGTVHFDDNFNKSVTFLLPFMYFNFLRPSEFDSEQFQQVFKLRQHQTVKSKVFYLSNYISQTAIDLPNIFKHSILKNQFLQICLRQQAEQRVYMTQIQLLRNQKAVVRIMPIPHTSQMLVKTKQLLNNLLFLLGS